jgi:hypothetical protein
MPRRYSSRERYTRQRQSKTAPNNQPRRTERIASRSADHIYTIESPAQDKTLSTLTSGDSVYVRVRNKRMSVVKKDKETQYKVLRVWMVEADVP